MIDRPSKKAASDEEQVQPPPRQIRRTEKRFLLKIDGQAKSSYADREAAMKAGRDIKMNFPVVNAAVYDSKEGTSEFC